MSAQASPGLSARATLAATRSAWHVVVAGEYAVARVGGRRCSRGVGSRFVEEDTEPGAWVCHISTT